jgi:hypothetical protein
MNRCTVALIVLVVLAAGPSANAQKTRASPVRVVQVVANDYALEAPDSIRASQLALEFENRGQHDHELIVGLLKPGVGADEIVAAHRRGLTFRQAPTAYLDGAAVGMLYAGPGTRSPARLTMPTVAGRSYILICQLRDSVGATPHVLLGMFKVVHVQ